MRYSINWKERPCSCIDSDTLLPEGSSISFKREDGT